MHRVGLFQVFLSNSNNYTQVYGFKYFNLPPIICKQSHRLKYRNNLCITHTHLSHASLTLGLEILRKFLCIILEFITLALAQLLNSSYRLKIRIHIFCNIIIRFIYLAFGFSWAGSLSARCMGWLGANLSAGVDARVREGYVVHRCQNKNPR